MSKSAKRGWVPFASALLMTCLHSAWFLLARALKVWSWVNCIAWVCTSVGCCFCCWGGGGGGAVFDGTAGSVGSTGWVSAASPVEASVALDFLGAT